MQTLASLEKGHEFPAMEFDLSPEWVRAYIAAVEDGAIGIMGAGAVPPMAIATLSIRALLERAGLPAGAVHAGQEMSFHRAVRTGERLTASARIVRRGERQGWVLMSVDMAVTAAGGGTVMTGRAMVTFPAQGEVQG